VLDGAAPFMDDARSKPLLEIAVADYEEAYSIQKDSLSNLPAHSQGELLGGLADGYRRLGNFDKATEYLTKMQRDAI
jgi:pentatricopeptide repeat protein